MNQYITGTMIKRLREDRKMTQAQLAEKLNVSDKAISKWETGRGYPDITLIEPLASALGISVIELLSGEDVTNTNRSFNMNRVKFYMCPICGNIVSSTGEAVISCCGIKLPVLEAEEPDSEHILKKEVVEDEYYVTISHEMSKKHYISFIAAVTDNRCEIEKLYPEWNPETRFEINRTRWIYYFCNQHGLYRVSLR
jgi:DNA-binding XRE family transcriptional regulator/desulfoferrodoxin (superoxide reductase-like protein)